MTRLFRGCLLLLSVGLVLTSDGSAHAKTVLVLALGDDPALIGRLQDGIEERVSNVDGFEVVMRSLVAKNVGVAVPARTAEDRDSETLSDKLLAVAQRAFYDDDLKAAERALVSVEEHYEGTLAIPTRQRVLLYLWRASIAHAKGDSEEQAASAARSALRLNPELRVNLGVFRPAIAQIVDRERELVNKERVDSRLIGVPDGATVLVDGREVGPTFSVPAGVHYVAVEATGYLPVKRSYVFDSETPAQSISMALAVDEGYERDLLDIIWDGRATFEQQGLLESLCKKFDAEVVVIAGVQRRRAGRMRGYVWHRQYRAELSSPRYKTTQEDDLLTWLEVEIPKKPQVPPPLPGSWVVTGGIGPVYSSLRRRMVSSNCNIDRGNRAFLDKRDSEGNALEYGDCYTDDPASSSHGLGVSGAGIQFRGELSRTKKRTQLYMTTRGGFTTFAPVKVTNTNPTSAGNITSRSVAHAYIDASSGYMFLTRDVGQQVRAGIGAQIGLHISGSPAQQLKVDGVETHLLPGYFVASLEGRLALQLPIGTRFHVNASGGIRSGVWVHVPRAVLGNPKRPVGTVVGAETQYRFFGRWRISLSVENAYWWLQNDGEAQVLMTPVPVEPALRYNLTTAAVRMYRIF